MINRTKIYVTALFTALLPAAACHAQQNYETEKIPSECANFIPPDYLVLGAASGDLDGDSTDDLVLAIRHKDEDAMADESRPLPPRLLLVLLKTSSGYRIAAESDKILLCRTCGGFNNDPFDDESIGVSKGELTVTQKGGGTRKWILVRSFKLLKNDMYLTSMSDDRYSNNGVCDDGFFADENLTEINYQNGHRHILHKSARCATLLDKTDKLKVLPLKKLSSVNLATYKF